DLVVHVMQPAIREYYGLEEIWGGKPVRVKTAESGAKRIAAHAAAADDEVVDAQPAVLVNRQDGKAVTTAASQSPRGVAKKKAPARSARKAPVDGARAKRARSASKPAKRTPAAKKTMRKTTSKSGATAARKKVRAA